MLECPYDCWKDVKPMLYNTSLLVYLLAINQLILISKNKLIIKHENLKPIAGSKTSWKPDVKKNSKCLAVVLFYNFILHGIRC